MPSTQLNQQSTVSRVHQVKRKENFQNPFDLEDDSDPPFVKRICRRPDGQDNIQGSDDAAVNCGNAFTQQHFHDANQEDMFAAMETESVQSPTDTEMKFGRNYVAENIDGSYAHQQLQLPTDGRVDAAYSMHKCYCRPSWDMTMDVNSVSQFLFY